MKVAIIGAGNVGKALGSSLIRAGHDVTFTSKSGATAREAAAELGGRAAGDAVSAVKDAEVVVLAVPFGEARAVSETIAPESAGLTIIDVTNPVRPTFDGLQHVDGRNAAQQIQAWLPNAAVVKAFNTVFAPNQADPVVDGVQLDAFVAGDDDSAKRRVLDLATSIGFNPVDAGSLAAATPLEYLAFLNMTINALNGWNWRSAWKLVGAPVAVGAAR